MRFRALDGFRGLCALLVALYHFPVYSHFMGPEFFLPNGQMLLDFFFVLSGFIIAASYGSKLKTWRDVGIFAQRRFARLWPLHAAVLAAFVAIELAKLLLAPGAGRTPPFTGPHAPEAILTNLLMIHSLDIHRMLTWNPPSWTISVEFYTYLIYAAIVVTWPRRPVLGATAMGLVGAFGVIVIAHQLSANYDYGLFRCFYGFFCGVLLWRLLPRFEPLLRDRPALASVAELAVTVGVFAYMAELGGAPFGYLGPLVFAIFIVVYACEQGQVTRAMRCAPLVRLGEISYSIYLVHYLVVVAIGLSLRSIERLAAVDFPAAGLVGLDGMTLVRFQSRWFMDGVSLAYLAVVILVAAQTYKFVEEPGRKLFGRLSFRRNPAPVRDGGHSETTKNPATPVAG